MHISFTGRRVVIAGGSRGIGRSIALGFCAAGANVSICARGPDKLRQTAEELRRLGATVHDAVCDLSDGAAVVDYVDAAADALGGIDVLVNNASGFGRSDDEEGWAASIDVDLMATVVCKVRPAINAAYRAKAEALGVSLRAVYDKLDRTEPNISAELVRHTARTLGPVITSMGGERVAWLPGYRVKVLDGNHLAGTQHRLKELRTVGAGALPGKALVASFQLCIVST